MQRIAIAGATGYIGGRLAPQLLDAGYALRCLARSPRKLEGRAWTADPRVEVRQVDLEDEASLTRALSACDAAFYLVHSMMSAGGAYAARDLELALTFARAARAAGVGRLVYLGGLGETGAGLSEHLASRRDVEGALASAGVPVTVLRAAMIIGSGSASFEIMRYLVQRLPVMITPKWVSTPCQPIAVENVLAYLVGVLRVPETAGEVFDIGGSETLCYRDIMRVMAEELGLPRRWIIPVPVLTPRLSSYWIHLVTPLSNRIARPLAEGLRNPVVCREDRITRLVPQPLLDVRQAIRAALGQVKSHLVETNWPMAGPLPGDPDWSGGAVFRDVREAAIPAPAWAAFRAVCRLGGRHGWYAGWLWRIRGWLDRLAGGPGLRRGRRDPEALRYGDALDFWRVAGIEPDSRLSLRAEMRLPGEALLDFRVQAEGERHCRLRQTALFEPRGLFGLFYWYAVLPFHGVVFRGMLAAIERDAVRIAALGFKSEQDVPVTIFLDDHRLRLANWSSKLQHLCGGVPLLLIGLKKLVADEAERPWALVELAVAGGVFVAFFRELLAERRHLTGQAETGSHSRLGWFDLAAGVLLIFEAFQGHHAKPGYLRPPFLAGLATLGIGLFHGRIQAAKSRRRYIRLDDSGFEFRAGRFRKLRLQWADLASVDLSGKKLVLHRTDGRRHSIRLQWFHNAAAIRQAVAAHPAVAALLDRGRPPQPEA